tara:strand:- start:685 stop:801 length:117 start_codon:yes stop_codon:yes gene_type:complete
VNALDNEAMGPYYPGKATIEGRDYSAPGLAMVLEQMVA